MTTLKAGRSGTVKAKSNLLRAIAPITATAIAMQSSSTMINPELVKSPNALFKMETVASRKTTHNGALNKEKRRSLDTPYANRKPGHSNKATKQMDKQKNESHICYFRSPMQGQHATAIFTANPLNNLKVNSNQILFTRANY